jgi:hypothetical protein
MTKFSGNQIVVLLCNAVKGNVVAQSRGCYGSVGDVVTQFGDLLAQFGDVLAQSMGCGGSLSLGMW